MICLFELTISNRPPHSYTWAYYVLCFAELEVTDHPNSEIEGSSFRLDLTKVSKSLINI